MLASSIPTKMTVVFGASAVSGTIRTVPVTSTGQSGSASYTGGFPPETQLPEGAGGVPPFGQDFNGLFNIVTAWLQWQQAGGGLLPYDSTFQTSIGGYPNNAVVGSVTTPGNFYISTTDNNVTNPDSGGAGWTPFSLSGGVASTGQIMVRPTFETSASAPPTNPGTSSSYVNGWVRANGNTIGNASSSATELASATTANLFSWLWTNFSNTQCPVSSGRGASAAADYAANKTIKLLDLRGYSGVWNGDTVGGTAGAAGAYTGVTFLTGNQNTAGATFGANAVTLTTAQLPVITPSGNVSSQQSPSANTNIGQATSGASAGGSFTASANPTGFGIVSSFTGNSFGGGSSHQNTPLGIIGTIYLKL